jgi:hypothetical protein
MQNRLSYSSSILALSLLLISCHVGGNVSNVDYKPKIIEPLTICLDIACKKVAGPLVKMPVHQSKPLYFTLNAAYHHKMVYTDIAITCNRQPCPFNIMDHPPCYLDISDMSRKSCEIFITTEEHISQINGANIIATIKELKNTQVSTFISVI